MVGRFHFAFLPLKNMQSNLYTVYTLYGMQLPNYIAQFNVTINIVGYQFGSLGFLYF